MTYENGVPSSDSVNLGSNPSSPATKNTDSSGLSGVSAALEQSEIQEQTAHTGHTQVGTVTAALRAWAARQPHDVMLVADLLAEQVEALAECPDNPVLRNLVNRSIGQLQH